MLPQQPFVGFAQPTSNTTYTPNQFFDVCVAHCSRGTVRLVAFLIRKTLGWSDAQGRPQAEQHAVSYAEFERAGVSRDMVKSAIDEAVKGHFIRCVRSPRANASGKTSISGLYELLWDERSADYIKDPKQFRGFFAGEGNRTYIPNQFFDLIVPYQPLSVVKVVGSVIRFSIGFQNKWGYRRHNVALSFQHLRNYTRLSDRTTLTQAIRHSLAANFIERVESGFFDPDGGKLSKAAVYALKWADLVPHMAIEETDGRKTRPAEIEPTKQSEIQTGNGRKTRPAEQSENQTDIEITQRNKTLKQQPAIAATFEKLRGAGFDAQAAQAIASRFTADRVERQIRWLESRKIKSNRLGLLRAAIEQDWPAPVTLAGGEQLGRPNSTRPVGISYGDALDQARRRFITKSNPSTP